MEISASYNYKNYPNDRCTVKNDHLILLPPQITVINIQQIVGMLGKTGQNAERLRYDNTNLEDRGNQQTITM